MQSIWRLAVVPACAAVTFDVPVLLFESIDMVEADDAI